MAAFKNKSATFIFILAIGALLSQAGLLFAQSGSISAGNAEGDKGQTIQIAVNLNGGSNVGAFGCDIGWDSSVLTYVDTGRGSLVPGSWTFGGNPQSSSSLSVGGFGTPDISGSGTIAVITFQIKATAAYGSTAISVSGVTDGLSAGGGGTVTIRAGVNIESFDADPDTISQGESTTLRWNIANATSASISNGVGSVNKVSGSVQVSPTETTTYTLTAEGPGGPRTATAKVTISQVPRPTIESFTVDKSTVVKGDQVIFSFKIKNAKSASIDNGVGAVSKSGGTAKAKVSKDTTFTLTAKNAGGSSTASVSVTVIAEPVIHWFTSSTSEDFPINSKETAHLGWSVFGADSVSINRGVGDVDTDGGMLPVNPDSNTTYLMTATNKAGTSTAEVTVYVTNKPRIADFRSVPASTLPGQSINLNWSVVGADSISIDPTIGPVSGNSGSRSNTPSGTTTFTITATNGSGTTTKSVKVEVVNDPPDLYVSLEKFSKKRLGIGPADSGRMLGSGNVGEPVELIAKVENLGKGEADSCPIRLVENGIVIAEQTLDDFGVGESQKIAFEYVPLHAGKSYVEIIADPDNYIPEYDKENNCFAGYFDADAIKGTDLVISNVTIKKPTLPGVKNMLSISFTITNVGTTSSGEFDYAAYISKKLNAITSKDDVVIKGSIADLPPSESMGVVKTIILKKVPKKFYFRGLVDTTSRVIEINENNNNLDKLFNRNKL